MKILFVVNNFYASGNGLSASARRTVQYLREAGQEVRVLSGPNLEQDSPQPDYILNVIKIPVFNPIITAHGYCFAGADKKIIREAVAWADLVHLEEPFVIEMVAGRIARQMGVPCTATYHLHPENMFSSVHLGGWKFLNNTTLRLWRDYVFNNCSHIQCPTKHVVDRLKRFHFKSELREISNGIIPDKCIRSAEPKPDNAPVNVVCIGRLAVEKDQYTLIKAIRYSRHADRIRLFFAGRGPEAEKMQRQAAKLYSDGVVKYAPEFKFRDRDQLRELAAASDIYVHCANVEVEGLSALEALQQGVVPVIAQGELTATAQFALDSRSLFPAGDAKALAERLDYWIEHPDERLAMGRRYAESMEAYDIHKSIDELIEMYRSAAAGRAAMAPGK
ncbi:MAG: glycosyltransferase [Bacteroidales bacterium]|nr:glycosyltransferase [Bacteroidales bacterium]